MNTRFYYAMRMVLAGLFFFSGMALASDNAPSVTVVDDYTVKGEMNFFSDIPPGDEQGNINVVVEIPKGTTGKWEVNTDTGNIIWEFKKGKPRTVEYKGGYPVNYGMIPQTAMPAEFGGDGESLDAVVLGDKILRGEVVKVKLMGILNVKEGDEFDGKLIAVRQGSPQAAAANLDELNSKFGGIVDEVVEWFTGYKGPGEIELQGLGSAEDAMEILQVSAEAYASGK